MNRILIAAALMTALFATPCPADEGDDGETPASAPARVLVSQAEQLELVGRYAPALTARESALEGFDQQIASLSRWSTAAQRRLASDEPGASDDALTGLVAWLAREQAAITAERERCRYWVTELKKEKFGAVPHLRHERGVAWAHEAAINDAVHRLRKLEDRKKWEAAHTARRKCLILAKAKRRFFDAKIDSLKRTLLHVKRNRRLKDTDAVAQMEQQIAFFETAMVWAAARIERFDAWVNAEAVPANNDAEVALWESWRRTSSSLGVPANAVSEQQRELLLARARGRSAWYLAKAASRNGDDNDGDD